MSTVSVIIPNYNHARFLDRRIGSVLGQRFQDFEVIILDDASTDESRAVIGRYAEAQAPRLRVLINKENSGLPGKQWNKGVAAARGRYIWIAESDDFAAPRFLDIMVDQLDRHPTAGLAYCQSWEVDENDEVVGSYACCSAHLDKSRWQQDFFNEGRDASQYFLSENVIPNASAVLFRKSVYEAAGGANETMRYCGDWLLWVDMLMISDLVYVAQPLNYYRRHAGALSSPEARWHAAPTTKPQVVPATATRAPETMPGALRQWPARIYYILGRNALRADQRAQARAHFQKSLHIYPFPSTVLFYIASYFKPRVYRSLDGIKARYPLLRRLLTGLNLALLRLRRAFQAS